MKNEVTVSVVIPVYNVEKYLRECVDSVLRQTYSSYEIILVDDGSTDSSGSICDEYAAKDSRISVVHKDNGGQSSARNIGIKKAVGKYIYFLDSDDYIVEYSFAKLVEAAEKTCSDIVFFDAVSFTDMNDFKVKQNYIRKNKYNTDKGVNVFAEMQKNNEFHCSPPLIFINRKFIKKSKLEFKEGIYYEDMLFTYQVLCHAKSVFQYRDALYRRRYRANSTMTSRKNTKHFISFVTVYKEVKRFSEEFGIADEDFAKAYTARCAFNCFNIYERLNENDKKANKNKLREIIADILKNNAYDNTALRMRCYGKIFWAAYKLIEIPFKKLRR